MLATHNVARLRLRSVHAGDSRGSGSFLNNAANSSFWALKRPGQKISLALSNDAKSLAHG
jgi:hypothetical protein